MYRSDKMEALDAIMDKFVPKHEVISIHLYDQVTGELLSHVDMGKIREALENKCLEAGLILPSEDEYLLSVSSATDEDLLAVMRHVMDEYRKTKGLADHAAFYAGYKVLKRRGIKDNRVEEFAKRYPA